MMGDVAWCWMMLGGVLLMFDGAVWCWVMLDSVG